MKCTGARRTCFVSDVKQGETRSTAYDPNATTWTLTAGYYYAGIDIPAGKFNAKAISGRGNLSSRTLHYRRVSRWR